MKPLAIMIASHNKFKISIIIDRKDNQKRKPTWKNSSKGIPQQAGVSIVHLKHTWQEKYNFLPFPLKNQYIKTKKRWLKN